MPAGNIWMRGILEEHYGVPHRQNTWLVDRSEDIAFDQPPDLRIEMKKNPKSLSDMLADGDIPAMISPTIPRPFTLGDKRIARLFPDYKAIEMEYFRTTGIFPIMHVTTIQQEIVDQYPWVRDQPGQGVRGLEADGLSAACRTRAWSRSPGCAPPSRSRKTIARARSVAVRADARQSQEPRDHPALCAPTGHGQQTRPLDDLFADTDLGDAGRHGARF